MQLDQPVRLILSACIATGKRTAANLTMRGMFGGSRYRTAFRVQFQNDGMGHGWHSMDGGRGSGRMDIRGSAEAPRFERGKGGRKIRKLLAVDHEKRAQAQLVGDMAQLVHQGGRE